MTDDTCAPRALNVNPDLIDIADLRFCRSVERLHRLGWRVLYELLAEFGAERLIQSAIDEKLNHWVARLDADVLAAVGGDRFPANPVHHLWGEEWTMDLARHIGDIARRILGDENKQRSTSRELRFGNKGSVSVEIAGPEAGHTFRFDTQEYGLGAFTLHDEPGLFLNLSGVFEEVRRATEDGS
jgi:hypothetical protein